MNERRAPFGTTELPGSEQPADLATSLAMGRELESMAVDAIEAPPPDFSARVMAVIAAEPAPHPAGVAALAVGRGRPLALVVAVRDAWRVMLSGGRPGIVRAQALVVVLVAAAVTGAIASLGGAGLAGALGMLRDGAPTVAPSPSVVSPLPSPSDQPSRSSMPSATPTTAPTATPAVTPSPTGTDEGDDDRTARPRTPAPTDDSSGPGSGGDSGSGADGSSGSGSDDSSGSGSDDSSGRGSGDDGSGSGT